MSASLAVSSPDHVAALLTVLTDRKVLPPADLKRLRLLAEHLGADWRLPLADALHLMFPDVPPSKAEANFRNLKSRLDKRQEEAIAAGRLHPEQRLVLKMSAKRDDAAQHVRFLGRPPLQAWARVDDLEGAERSGPLYDNMAARPPGAEPILLLTVNDHEREAVLDVFLEGGKPHPFLIDDFPYDYLADAPGEAGHTRPVIAFRCQMGSLRSGAALPRVADAIRHLRPCAVLAVGIAFGDKRKQALADVLIADQVQSYESARLNPDGRHAWRSEKPAAEGRWLERCTQLALPGITRRKGLLLCGELLVDNAPFRKLLADEFPQAIGGDMESFGLAVACNHEKVHWAVIKAVCDWGDGTINDDGDAQKTVRQRRAALKAAQVAYSAVFLHVPRGLLEEVSSREPLANAEPRTQDHDEVAKRKELELFGHAHSQRDGDRTLDTAAHSIHQSLLAWLETVNAAPVFALLGEYGMGKTISCQRLYKALKAARQAPDAPAWMRRPVYFDLREVSLFKGRARGAETPMPTAEALVNDLFDFGWTAAPGQKKPRYEDLQKWLADGALLILDGLDECLVHLDEDQHGQFIQMLLRLVSDYLPDDTTATSRPSPRLLVSCRTNFFKTLSDQRNSFTGYRRGKVDAQRYESRILLPLTEAQIREYLEAVLPELPIAQVEALIDSTHNLREMAERPMTLKLLGEYIPELEAERAAGRVVNGAFLYGRVANKWLQRDQGKHHLRPEHKLRLMPALAAHLWRSGVRSLPYDELHAWFHDWRDTQPDLARLYAPSVYNQSKLEEDLRTATFVVRQDDATVRGMERSGWGAAASTEGFRFAHSSLAEYFLAVYLADAVRADRFEDWAMPVPSDETLDFLAQKLVLDEAALAATRGRDGGLIAILNHWRKAYREEASEMLLRHALRTLRLPKAERIAPMLAGFDLSGAKLRGWCFGSRLPKAEMPLQDMAGVMWRDADLRDCDFSYVRLDEGNFSGARLDLAAFQHCSAQQCDWRSSDLVGTEFRHCQLEGSHWEPSRLCHRPKMVACSGGEMLAALRSPNFVACELSSQTSQYRVDIEPHSRPPLLRAVLASGLCSMPSVALSEDGGYFVSGADDGTVRIWDASTSECLSVLRGHVGPVYCVAVNAKADRIVSGSLDCTIRMWSASTGKCLFVLHGHVKSVTGVAFNEALNIVVSCSNDGTIRMWNASTGKCIREMSGHARPVTSVALSVDGSRVFSGSLDRTVRVWDTSSGKCLRQLRGHAGPVYGIALSAQGGKVASNASDCTIRIWDALSGDFLRDLSCQPDWMRAIALSADAGKLLSGSNDGSIWLWDPLTGERLRKMRGHAGVVRSVALSPDGSCAVSSSEDGTIGVWDGVSGECLRMLRSSVGVVLGLALNSGGSYGVSGSDDGTVRVWNASNGECIREMSGHTNSVLSVALSVDALRAVSGSSDGTIRVWDVSKGECISEMLGHTKSVLSVAFSPDGDRVVSGSIDGKIRLWNVLNGICEREFLGNAQVVRSVAFDAEGVRVVSGLEDGRFLIWDTSNGEEFQAFGTKWDVVLSVAFSADGGKVISGSSIRAVSIWDVQSRKEDVSALSINAGKLKDLALSADGSKAVSASDDGTIRVWDTSDGQCLRELRGHGKKVVRVTLSLDAGRVLFSSDDGTVCCISLVDKQSEGVLCDWIAAVGSPHGIPSHASWRPGRDGESDTLISASGDAWRFLSWDMEDPSEPSGWKRVPLQGYE